MFYHVQQGEHITKIAARFGVMFQDLWDHPQNAELRQQRGNPNVLRPGDKLFIPDRTLKTESGSTEQRHLFRLKQDRLLLRLDVKDMLGRDVAGAPCELHIGAEQQEMTVPDDGIIEVRIPPTAEEAVVVVDGVARRLRIGEIDPIDESAGQRKRLYNLGYFESDSDESEEPEALSDAVHRFQMDHDLEPTGTCDEATRSELVKAHGC